MMPRTSTVITSFLLILIPCITFAWTADELLMRAVRSGDHATAEKLVASTDVNHLLPDGSTPLAWAVESQDVAMVQLLLKAGASPRVANSASVAPLLIACEYGDAAIIDMLLAAEADVNATRSDGITPLAICAGNAKAATVERLIAAGATIDQTDHAGQTPLMWAAAKGRIETIQLLLKHGADVNRITAKGFTPLFFAVKSGEPAAPVVVLEAGGNPDHVGPGNTSVVQLAMYQQDFAFAARMIERGVDLTAFDRNGNQLLHAAILADQPALVRQLLAKGASADVMTGTSLVEWRFERNFKSSDYYVPPKTPLLLAAERGAASIMRMLADAGADTSLRAEDGTSIVLAAAASGTMAALEVALELEPDPNVTNKSGDTPLHLLLNSGGRTDGSPAEYAPMMQLLAMKGARTDISNRRGRTAADLAIDAESDVKAIFLANFTTGMAAL
ncbi:MAG: ankyrin repeat domain-containing protein [Pseudomonadota bacterium]